MTAFVEAHILGLSNGGRIIALVGGLFVLAVMVELLRRRQLREKYAALWLLVSLVVVVLGIFPKLLDQTARAVGVANPPDLLLFLASIVLLLVCVHLSWEIGRLEDKSRYLAEDVAILREKLDQERSSTPPSP
jgi:hypothetical protein